MSPPSVIYPWLDVIIRNKKNMYIMYKTRAYRQSSPEGCLMRKVNKTPKVEAAGGTVRWRVHDLLNIYEK